MERQFGAGFHGDPRLGGDLRGMGMGERPWARSEYDSDNGSLYSSEEDMWGGEVGGVSIPFLPSFFPTLLMT